ncbi:hypothetical protein [Entomomonas asaccharolytica]|uniref:Uncharacterized protein n=1 Tax=Entomomonas asaccharolytica TaxID=2785331 RepID=A0A974RXK5_9GAMM|nr:hypothetical protein [Entomomonas asaccharolytica]QQP86270.1 hypothetical protein JHT90_03235 [Entomomonas asaccharolytica]
MDESMRDDVRQTLVNLYGYHVVKNWQINEAVANVLLEYIAEVGDCNNAMAWVPRPLAPGKKPLTELGKYAAGKLFKSTADSTPGCMNQAKNTYRRRFDDASSSY